MHCTGSISYLECRNEVYRGPGLSTVASEAATCPRPGFLQVRPGLRLAYLFSKLGAGAGDGLVVINPDPDPGASP
jgi:hypothetical protein